MAPPPAVSGVSTTQLPYFVAVTLLPSFKFNQSASPVAVAVPSNTVLSMCTTSLVPASVDTNISSDDVIDPISESSMTTKAVVVSAPDALRLGEVSTVSVLLKLGVVPVWNLTNSLASAPVASVFMLTVPLTSVAVTPLTVLIAVAALLAVIGAESVTSVYPMASSVVMLIETEYVVDS